MSNTQLPQKVAEQIEADAKLYAEEAGGENTTHGEKALWRECYKDGATSYAEKLMVAENLLKEAYDLIVPGHYDENAIVHEIKQYLDGAK